MNFGLTNDAKLEIVTRYDDTLMKRFAFLPTKMQDGSWVWLGYYWQRHMQHSWVCLAAHRYSITGIPRYITRECEVLDWTRHKNSVTKAMKYFKRH